MNERIKELAEQAGLDIEVEEDENASYVFNETLEYIADSYGIDLKKFAELIVQDAVNVMKQEWYDLNNAPKVDGETPRDVGLRVGAKSQTIHLMHMIKKHFGIEK